MEIKTSPKRRKCKYPLCKQELSIYNHGTYCNVHHGLMFWKDNIEKVPSAVKS